ncbi:DUF2231 domain-containing protein [Pseudanabaena sp. UWO311]|uniref:DUF2231 domain-containing protein n=1 Tax=Pseudanabaena sp. UWO311 TaxID=2487337 RepID=UPI001157B04D|nr:DUF2231 domain-containing protein [Pseudanabaena sp. UWO311]TYQ26738.1 DUF2231 domain-containing protein [Pseudanabaena sp. UWO311]
MNPDLINQLGSQLGVNGLPYAIPIHPNLVHMTLGLFIVAIGFDFVGVFFVLEKPFFKFLAIPAARSNFFDVGWYNMVAASIITFFTVAAGFYEILLATPDPNVKSAWGFQAMETMIWHGVGGVLLLALIVGMTVWRGFQRFLWRKDMGQQVQWSYLLAGLAIFVIMFAHGTLGAQLASEFGVHITADRLLRLGNNADLNQLLK